MKQKHIWILLLTLIVMTITLLVPSTLPARAQGEKQEICATPTTRAPTATPTLILPSTPTAFPTTISTVGPTTTPTPPAGNPTPLPTSVSTPPSSGALPADLQVADTSLEFQAQAESISDLSFSIKNTSAEPIIWLLLKPESSPTWIRVPVATPQELAPGQETRIALQIDTHGLGPGTYLGMVLLISNSGQAIIGLSLKMTVLGGGSTQATPPTQISLLFDEEEKAAKKGTPTPVVCVTKTPSVTPQTPVGTTATSSPVATATATNTAQTSCSESSPYGFTTINANEQLVNQFRELNVCWLRYQIHESDLRTGSGYNWRKLDTAVSLMNQAGINLLVALQCFGGGCFSNPTIPSPEQMATYARAIAERYNGTSGHGRISAFSIGNEEYGLANVSMSQYGQILAAGYDAIKAEHPGALVGTFGPYKRTASEMSKILGGLQPFTQSFDFAAIHYYVGGADPASSGSSHSSLKTMIDLAQQVLPDKPLWITEIGWPTRDVSCCKAVTPQQQAEYLRYVMEESMRSGVAKVFWFTINYGSQGNTISPPSGPLPAFFEYKRIVEQFPTWPSGQNGSASSEGIMPIPTSVIPAPTTVVPDPAATGADGDL